MKFVSGAGIHLREKNIAGPTERSQNARILQAHREGPAFFDEDGACTGFINPYAVRLNRYVVPLIIHIF